MIINGNWPLHHGDKGDWCYVQQKGGCTPHLTIPPPTPLPRWLLFGKSVPEVSDFFQKKQNSDFLTRNLLAEKCWLGFLDTPQAKQNLSVNLTWPIDDPSAVEFFHQQQTELFSLLMRNCEVLWNPSFKGVASPIPNLIAICCLPMCGVSEHVKISVVGHITVRLEKGVHEVTGRQNVIHSFNGGF